MVAELGALVAADLAAEHGMVAFEKIQRRDVDDDLSSWPQHPIHLIERSALHFVVEGVEDVERGDQIELTRREGQLRRRGAGDERLAVVPGVGQSAPRDVDAAGAAVPAKHRQVVAGAAAAIEDQRIGDAGGGPDEQRRDEAAKTLEPEVSTLGARGGFEQSVHVVRV